MYGCTRPLVAFYGRMAAWTDPLATVRARALQCGSGLTRCTRGSGLRLSSFISCSLALASPSPQHDRLARTSNEDEQMQELDARFPHEVS